MIKFNQIKGKVAYLPIANIDTDMIIPKQYLKTITRSGLREFLFAELRYDIQGSINPEFILNKEPEIKILISGENFGCGSSREHAVWSLLDFGIRAIIAPSYADIFYNNCFKNGLLPIVLSENKIEALVGKGSEITIDLPKQQIVCSDMNIKFDIDSHRKEILIKGLDDIEKILRFDDEIVEFEKRYFKKFNWLRGA